MVQGPLHKSLLLPPLNTVVVCSRNKQMIDPASLQYLIEPWIFLHISGTKYCLNYRTQEAEGSQPAMEIRRNVDVNVMCNIKM